MHLKSREDFYQFLKALQLVFCRKNLVGAIGLELKKAGRRDNGLECMTPTLTLHAPLKHSPMSPENVPGTLSLITFLAKAPRFSRDRTSLT